MITSKFTPIDEPTSAFVWIWLPDQTEPVVAGKLTLDNDRILFNYGRSYLERINTDKPAIAIYDTELPLKRGLLTPLDGLTIPGCIRDASPDAWGRRVILNKKMGSKGLDTETDCLNELSYLLESGSDRIGALDFQLSPTEYVARSANNTPLNELLESAERVEKGIPLTPELDRALLYGSSIGGARPKALIDDMDKKYVAKFSLSTDLYNLIKAEFIAMRLAKLAGLNVSSVHLLNVSGKDILMVERFDRIKVNSGWKRTLILSALTLLGLDDMMARYASYEQLAHIVRHRFTEPKKTLKELFSRLVFNILCGNTDDHARNHSAFWNGEELTLTPAYDICPQGRTGQEASQAMLIVGNRNLSQINTCIEASQLFLLSASEAIEIVQHQKAVIEQHWDSVCDEATLSLIDRKFLWKRQFLNPFAFT